VQSSPPGLRPLDPHLPAVIEQSQHRSSDLTQKSDRPSCRLDASSSPRAHGPLMAGLERASARHVTKILVSWRCQADVASCADAVRVDRATTGVPSALSSAVLDHNVAKWQMDDVYRLTLRSVLCPSASYPSGRHRGSCRVDANAGADAWLNTPNRFYVMFQIRFREARVMSRVSPKNSSITTETDWGTAVASGVGSRLAS